MSPDVGDKFGVDEDVEAHAHHLLCCEQLVGRVPGEDLLELRPPLPAVAGGGGDYVRSCQAHQLLKTNGVDVRGGSELLRLGKGEGGGGSGRQRGNQLNIEQASSTWTADSHVF